mmetsp:Transcript_46635/g.120290  ORF Transcript_46635/g.120290 Transcript_46635/m.120290 type:complete len:202 (+) Transcript_46635:1178-1783(+)
MYVYRLACHMSSSRANSESISGPRCICSSLSLPLSSSSRWGSITLLPSAPDECFPPFFFLTSLVRVAFFFFGEPLRCPRPERPPRSGISVSDADKLFFRAVFLPPVFFPRFVTAAAGGAIPAISSSDCVDMALPAPKSRDMREVPFFTLASPTSSPLDIADLEWWGGMGGGGEARREREMKSSTSFFVTASLTNFGGVLST